VGKQELFAIVRVFDKGRAWKPSQTVDTGLTREQAEERREAWLLGPATRYVDLIFPQESAPPMPQKQKKVYKKKRSNTEVGHG
jgi:hypothetical protein